ncbi:MAG: DMT family transporter [Variovorax sp.]
MSVPKESAEISPARGRLFSGLGWAALALVILSGWFVVTRLSVTRELRTWDILALRFGVGALVLFPILVVQRRQISARQWREGLVLAFLWGAPFVLFVAFGLQLTSAAQASSVTPGLMPVFAGLFAWAVLGEVPGPARLFGYAVIVAGVVALLAAQLLSGGPQSSRIGLVSLVVASALWAVYTLRFRRGELTPPQAAAFVCVWSAILYLPFYLLSGLSRLGRAPLQEVGLQALYQGVLMSAVAMLAYNRAVALLGAAAASAIVGLVPVVATLLAVPVLGEVPTALACAAIGAISVGVMLAARPSASPILVAMDDAT